MSDTLNESLGSEELAILYFEDEKLKKDSLQNTEIENIDEVLTELKEKGEIEKESEEEKKYHLTEKGEEERDKIWNEIKEEKIILIDDKDTVQLKLKNIKNLLTEKSIVEILKKIDEDNVLDLRKDDQVYDELIGREEEIEELRKSLKNTKNNSSKAIFVAGDTGIGKTRLVEEIKRWALEENFDFLKGKCHLEEHEPYYPFKDALEKFLKIEREIGEYESVISPSQTSEGKAHTQQMFDAQRKSVFYGTTKFLENLCEFRPLVLFLDDLQWADKGTLNLLDYMTDKLKDKPILMVGTYRPGDVSEDHPLKETMRRMSRKKLYDKIELSPIKTDTIEELVKSLINVEKVPNSFTKNMEEKTNGNPLFIKENINQMIEEKLIDPIEGTFPDHSDIVLIPDVVHEVIEKRVYKLEDKTRKILQLGSVIGRKVPFELIVEASDEDELAILDRVDDLLENNIWREHPREEAFLFSHDLFVDTIYEGIGKWVERKELHQSVAEAIEKVYENDLEDMYFTIGRHYQKAEEHKKAYEYFKKAGEKAERVYSHEDAIERYKESLEVAEKAESVDEEAAFVLMEKIGETNNIIGDYEEARKYFNRALTKTDEIEKQRRLYRKMAQTWSNQGEPDKVINVTEKGLELTEIEQNILDESEKEDEREFENSFEICRLLSHKGWALTRIGKYEEAQEIFHEELERAKELDEKSLLAQAYHDLGSMERGEKSTDDCIRYLEKAIEIREEILEEQNLTKERFDLSRSYNNLGVIHLDRRQLEKAVSNFQRVLDLNEKMNTKHLKVLSLQNLALIFRYKGELEKSENILEKIFEIFEVIEDRHGLLLAKNTRGRIAFERGNFEEAIRYFEESLEIAQDSDIKFRIVEVRTNISKTHIWLDELEEARHHIEKAYELSEKIQNNRALGMSLYMRGRSERLTGDVEKSIKSHKRGIEITTQTDERVDLLNNRCELIEDYLVKEDLNKAEKELNKAKDIKLETPHFQTWLRMLEGILLRERGNLEEAEKILKECLNDTKEASKMYRVARLNCELGKLMERKEEDKEARKFFEEGVRLSEKKGIKLISKRCEEGLNELSQK